MRRKAREELRAKLIADGTPITSWRAAMREAREAKAKAVTSASQMLKQGKTQKGVRSVCNDATNTTPTKIGVKKKKKRQAAPSATLTQANLVAAPASKADVAVKSTAADAAQSSVVVKKKKKKTLTRPSATAHSAEAVAPVTAKLDPGHGKASSPNVPTSAKSSSIFAAAKPRVEAAVVKSHGSTAGAVGADFDLDDLLDFEMGPSTTTSRANAPAKAKATASPTPKPAPKPVKTEGAALRWLMGGM
eukprot:TRINITY_DN72176_c0_g1_i1.p1 TRINITY_DN72176_c0_g1~~TRINITY_DN72176_c0_g1_i1.p1  ORF type:complete len:270 (-),score=43.61 TRINITY_DN72176_c0_g1_i1:232-972(-)